MEFLVVKVDYYLGLQNFVDDVGGIGGFEISIDSPKHVNPLTRSFKSRHEMLRLKNQVELCPEALPLLEGSRLGRPARPPPRCRCRINGKPPGNVQRHYGGLCRWRD